MFYKALSLVVAVVTVGTKALVAAEARLAMNAEGTLEISSTNSVAGSETESKREAGEELEATVGGAGVLCTGGDAAATGNTSAVLFFCFEVFLETSGDFLPEGDCSTPLGLVLVLLGGAGERENWPVLVLGCLLPALFSFLVGSCISLLTHVLIRSLSSLRAEEKTSSSSQ